MEIRKLALNISNLASFNIVIDQYRHIYIFLITGWYCPLGTANYTDFPCPTGFYCPNGTQFWNDYPCPTGMRVAY